MKHEFPRQIFEKKSKISCFIKIRPVRAEVFHADGRADRYDEANGRFSQFCERAKRNLIAFKIPGYSVTKHFPLVSETRSVNNSEHIYAWSEITSITYVRKNVTWARRKNQLKRK